MSKKKLQLNLDSFLGIKADIRKYFFIDWNKSSNNEIPIAQWLHEKPKRTSWSQIIKWKDVGDIMICCDDNKTFLEEDSKNFNLDTQLKIINRKNWDEKKSLMNFLKSHLQKCFRRQKNIEGLRTSYEIMLININELLRRVCIILFEDVQMKDYFPTMVWLMAAVSKGFILQSYHVNLELKFINDLCLENGYDDLSELNKYENHYKKVDVRNLLLEIEGDKILTEEQKSLIYSIGLRIGFGGRESDMKMIFDYSLLWYNKFKINLTEKNLDKNIKSLDVDKSNFVSIEFCQNNRFQKIDDFVYQGVDMMSYFKIVSEIYEEINHHYTEEEISDTIWYLSSAWNPRKKTQNEEKLKPCWDEIKVILKRKQIFFLKYILSKLNS